MARLGVSFLLRALRWLSRKQAALKQARKWLRSRFCWPEAAQACWRDAKAFGLLAQQDLKVWKFTLWKQAPMQAAQCRHCFDDLNAHGVCSCVEFETQLEVRGYETI